METYTQEHRRIAIETPLGKDVLLLAELAGAEELSRPFTFQLGLLSSDDGIRPAAIVGKNITFYLELLDGSRRFFNGYVRSFVFTGRDDRLAHYNAQIVPWLWFLDQTSDCRIFQNKSVVQIIEECFADHAFAEFETSEVIGEHPQREYCVQYRETDLAFVSRLMEEEGIFYTFRHENGRHVLVLADHKGAYQDCPEKEVDFRNPITAQEIDELITDWRHSYSFRPGKVAHTDYNFKTPTAPMEAESPTVIELENISDFELYDYPGAYVKKSHGEDLARIRMEEQEVPHETVEARSRCRTFFAGGKFKMKEHHAKAEEGREYVVTSVRHFASAAMGYQTGGTEPALEYDNSFICIPAESTFRPARTTPRPIVHGSQTAVVVGPSGEEIYTDEYGRIKVQFHWDRYSKADENSSCWIRVAQIWAGKNWGAMFLPRIGQEVIVDFLEGDPDRPIVTGRVYHDESMPPYELPDKKNISTIKSNSTKDGGGFNELRLDDTKGEEQIFIHAEKNQDIRVKNDTYETIVNDRHLIVQNDQLEQVDGDKHLSVKGDQNEKIDGTISVEAGMDLQQKAGMNHALEAGMEIHLKAGVNLVVESGTNLTLKVGGNFININPGGVFIQGTMVMINSGGAAGSGAGCTPEPPVAPIEADTAEPGSKVEPPTPEPPPPTEFSPAATVLQRAADDGTPFCEACERAKQEQQQQQQQSQNA